MDIRLFDCHAILGRNIRGTALEPTTVETLLAEMARLGIDRALISHFSAWQSEPILGNQKLNEATGAHRQLIPCPVVLPEACGDVPSVGEQLKHAVAVRLMPAIMRWSVAPWCADRLLAALQERRLPSVIPATEITLENLHDMLTGYPELRVILVDVHIRDNRMLLPLMQRHRRLYLAVHPPFSSHNGLELFCERLGADQLLFGTAYPVAAPGAAIATLMYARISQEQKIQIGAVNLERLLREVSRC